MRTGGWRYPVTGRDWSQLATEYRSAPPVVHPIREVVESVAASRVRDSLVFATSMWDLIVTSAPADEPPLDVVAVRGGMANPSIAADRVLVEHLPLVGAADAIERPASEAVRLFWRFMAEKYGITAARNTV